MGRGAIQSIKKHDDGRIGTIVIVVPPYFILHSSGDRRWSSDTELWIGLSALAHLSVFPLLVLTLLVNSPYSDIAIILIWPGLDKIS